MDEQITYHGFWPAPMRALAQVAEWMDWMRPILYCLLAVAVVGLVLTLLDMALLFWKELQATKSKNAINAGNAVSEVTNEADAILKKPSLNAIKALFLLLCW